MTRLERLWDAFSVYFGSTPREAARLRVFLVGPGGAEEFSPGSGGFVRTGYRPVLVSSVDQDEQGRSWGASAHELVHFLSAYWLPRQPRWIGEGLAQYLGDATFKDETTLTFGGWRWLDHPVHDLQHLWDWDRASGTPEMERDRYLSAWAYLHYFANRDEARLARLWTALRSAPSARAGFESVVPAAEWPALRQAVQAYLDEGRFSRWKSETRRTPQLGATSTLAPWEVHLARATLFESDGLRKAARAEVLLAETLAPQPAPPALRLATLTVDEGGPARTEALLALSRSEGAPSDVFIELVRRADLSPAERLAFAEEAVRRAPLDPWALALLTDQALVTPGASPRALVASESLIGLAPWSRRAWQQRARSLLAASRCTEAHAALDVAESLGHGHSTGHRERNLELRAAIRETCTEQR